MGGGSECAARGTREQTKIDRATVPARRDLDPRTSALCVRGSYYEYNVRGYAVIPGVDIRCHAFSHQYRVTKLNSTNLSVVGNCFLRRRRNVGVGKCESAAVRASKLTPVGESKAMQKPCCVVSRLRGKAKRLAGQGKQEARQ